MSFVPLTEEEKQETKPPCFDPQHSPPTHIVLLEPQKWRCPSCGREVIIRPPLIRW